MVKAVYMHIARNTFRLTMYYYGILCQLIHMYCTPSFGLLIGQSVNNVKKLSVNKAYRVHHKLVQCSQESTDMCHWQHRHRSHMEGHTQLVRRYESSVNLIIYVCLTI